MADDSGGRDPVSWRVRRWAAPVALAAAVAGSVGAANLLADELPAASGAPAARPRFILTVGQSGSRSSGPEPWFEVRSIPGPDGRAGLVDSVARPSPSAGAAAEILAGPGDTFVVVSTRDEPCESVLYRFRLTGDGRVKGVRPVNGGGTPARAAGPALSPDGDRIAFATAPCADAERPSAALTVLDLRSGHRRTWSTPGAAVLGDIAWADDGRTLGYAVSDVPPTASPEFESGVGRIGRDVANTTVYALDTRAKGADLRAGRVLFRQPDGPGVVTAAVMDQDGRTGYGVMKEPGRTIMFGFAEGKPMRVTHTTETKAGSVDFVALSTVGDRPRYACVGGIDAFGRVVDGDLVAANGGARQCGSAFAH
ncbi:PD40 domain-containing protein [Actinomadura decatromicini]|uniref:Uncharacterized protein n=1 Tax=Actinomadura decatromicini TaxID=2604572 RepID=A0A5D3F9K6_9ACTN|nr:PD40 domain-containing protein [Actinomadura decatromicini]TYK44360.1 hypothetical protein FXF68_33300 [Actinomadura decatromicini]